jgi:hypothetical protein
MIGDLRPEHWCDVLPFDRRTSGLRGEPALVL